jgi:predicted DNA-binding transcriptional regulator AlpA
MYTIKEFCEFARISLRHFYALKAQGIGPSVTRLGLSVRITKEATRDWLDKHTERSA